MTSKKTSFLISLALLGLLTFAVACRHTNPATEKRAEAYPHKDRVFIAFINDSDQRLTTDDVMILLFSKGIYPYVEGSSAGQDVMVKKKYAQAAVNAIAENTSFQGRGIWINKAFLSTVLTNAAEVKMGNEIWLDLSKAQK